MCRHAAHACSRFCLLALRRFPGDGALFVNPSRLPSPRRVTRPAGSDGAKLSPRLARALP
jgi:hypothetical protein